MTRQQINKNQNISFPTTERPLEPSKKGTPQTLEEKKEARADSFEEDAKISAQTSYDTENQLSSNLITVTLAFVALISVAISSSDLIAMLSVSQKWLILAALIIFCISILAGLINFFYNMRLHQKNSTANDVIAKQVDGVKTSRELSNLEDAEIVARSVGQSRKIAFLLTQIVLMCIGLVLVVAFVGLLLFSA